MNYQDTFFQTYKENGKEITCWWGIVNKNMSFFIIDETNGMNDTITFKLQAGDNGNKGLLKIGDKETCLDNTSTVVYINDKGMEEKTYPITENELMEYLNAGKFLLTLKGLEEYYNELHA